MSSVQFQDLPPTGQIPAVKYKTVAVLLTWCYIDNGKVFTIKTAQAFLSRIN